MMAYEPSDQEANGSIDRYVTAMIRAVPPGSRPPPNVCCSSCPLAIPMREGERLRIFCQQIGVFTWPNVALDDCAARERAIRSA